MVFSSCTNSRSEMNTISNTHAYYDSIKKEIESFIVSIESEKIVLDSSTNTSINATTKTFDLVELKINYKIKNNLLSEVHYDFFYDSLSLNLSSDIDSILNYLITRLGEKTNAFSSESMITSSWKLNKQIFDFEVFNNGYSITLRKNERTEKEVIKAEIPRFLKLTDLLMASIKNEKLHLGISDSSVVNSLFNTRYSSDRKQLIFSETYDKEILLSGTFELNSNNLSAIYFDYMYASPNLEIIKSDAAKLKAIIKSYFDLPEEVATTTMANTYLWLINPPLTLEIYSDGYSIIWTETTPSI